MVTSTRVNSIWKRPSVKVIRANCSYNLFRLNKCASFIPEQVSCECMSVLKVKATVTMYKEARMASMVLNLKIKLAIGHLTALFLWSLHATKIILIKKQYYCLINFHSTLLSQVIINWWLCLFKHFFETYKSKHCWYVLMLKYSVISKTLLKFLTLNNNWTVLTLKWFNQPSVCRGSKPYFFFWDQKLLFFILTIV